MRGLKRREPRRSRVISRLSLKRYLMAQERLQNFLRKRGEKKGGMISTIEETGDT